ncbi:MAG: hypothetical protein COA62_16185 [Rhodobiaceae bacterium]|nr:MAG: hypothetical protein COA62_16185 [Rhodobiaceae bacterium]
MTTFDYARLALEVYFDNPDLEVGGYTRPTDGTSDTLIGFTPITTNFFGAYYKDTAGNVIITYRGTDSLGELLSNASWGTDWPVNDPPLQVLDAYNFYLAVVAVEGSSANVSFAGHSLGGGLAGTIAV